MIIAVTIIHVIVSIGLILVVLLQTGKGAVRSVRYSADPAPRFLAAAEQAIF